MASSFIDWAAGRRGIGERCSPAGSGVLVAVGIAAVALKAPTDDAFSVPGTEAQRAIDLLDAEVPRHRRRDRTRRVRRAGGAHARRGALQHAAGADARARAEGAADRAGHGLAQDAAHAVQGQARRLRRHQLHCSGRQDHRRDQGGAGAGRRTRRAKAGLEVEFSGGIISHRRGRRLGTRSSASSSRSSCCWSPSARWSPPGCRCSPRSSASASACSGIDGAHRRLDAVNYRTDSRPDARPGRRHRLRAVHRLPAPPAGARRAWRPRSRSAGPPAPPAPRWSSPA